MPAPNNTDSTFNEFPAFPRIAATDELIVTRGQTKPVWECALPDGSDTRAGTAGVFVGLMPGAPFTGVNQLGAVPGFEYFDVPPYAGIKFDQFPGAPTPVGSRWIAFKGNYTYAYGTETRTGVYYRSIYGRGGEAPVRRIADTTMDIPGTTTKFGSTAPPSGAANSVVFTGLDNEDFPTMGGIYRSAVPRTGDLETLIQIGDQPPGLRSQSFTTFGEALTYDGKNLGFWGAWGAKTRTVTLHCPTDGNADVIAECIKQCPDVDEIGNYCLRDVPVNQGLFVRPPNGRLRWVARAGANAEFQDFLFWVFSGRPPTVGPDESEDFEPPRWRSSAFIAISRHTDGVAAVFKASKASGETGLYKRANFVAPIQPLLLVGDDAAGIDSAAPVGSVVTAVGVERDCFRNCALAVNASFLEPVSSESWAGVYTNYTACSPTAEAGGAN